LAAFWRATIFPPQRPTSRSACCCSTRAFWTGPAPVDDPLTGFFFQVASEQLLPLADRIERFSGESELVSGVRTVEALGETPGHTGLLIESDDERLFSMGDNATHFKIAFERPEWLSGVNIDPEQARQTKGRLLDWVARERIQTFGDHHPFPGLGFVSRNPLARRWRWTPAG
jgi:glyoxylase-like metal-dependent hydrolase (beta-lactamase superfamily II)